jgi:hypothetical protein
MPLYIVKNKFKVYKGEKSAEPKFRKALSLQLIEKFGKGPFTQEEISEIIKYCLDFYIEEFIKICKAETSFFFYQSILMFHEDATEIAVLHRGESGHPDISGEYLAVYRRILKFILETGCEVDIKTVRPVQSDVPRIQKIMDDLLFLGDMILMCVSLYAEQGMIEDVGELTFDKNDLYVFSRRHHYNFIFDDIKQTWGHNVEKVIIDDNGMQDLFDAMQTCLNVKYQDAGGVIAAIHKEIHFTEGVKWENLPENLERLFHIPYKHGELFYRGLTLSRRNKMSLLDLACKPNNLKRYLYRPIIIWNVNGKEFAIIGSNAWSETMIQFTTNALPWGKGPEEWMVNDCFKTFVHRKEDQHDKWLDNAVEAILMDSNCYYERNVTKLHNGTGYTNIDVAGLGEVDFIIVAHDIKKIMIVDCKHLMGRYDAANQKNDFNAFTKGSKRTKSYNQTMQNKTEWFSDNVQLIESHFVKKFQLDFLDLSEYSCEGIFIINTPTLYMYNADFRIYLLNNITAVLNGSYTDKTFLIHLDDEESIRLLNVPYPYFKKPSLLTIDPFTDEE